MYSTRHSLPNPDEATTQILDNGKQIATQGYAGKNVLETITYSTEGTDPKDGTYYSYYLTRDKKYFQLMAFLEEEENLNLVAFNPPSPPLEGGTTPLLSKEGLGVVYAIDYSTRYPKVFGKKLGILVDSNNTPIQELTGSLDISNVGDLELKSYLKDYDYLSGTGTTFQPLATFAKVGGKFCSTGNLGCIDPNLSHFEIVKDVLGDNSILYYFPTLDSNLFEEIISGNDITSDEEPVLSILNYKNTQLNALKINNNYFDTNVNIVDLGGEYSYSFVVKINSYINGTKVMDQGQYTDGTVLFGRNNLTGIYFYNSQLYYSQYNSSGNFSTVSLLDSNETNNLADGNTHHLVFTRNSTVIKIYIDGVLKNTETVSSTLQSDYDPVNMTGNQNSGDIIYSNIRFFNRELSDGDVQKLVSRY